MMSMTAHRSCRGFSLIEVTIAMGLSTLIVGGMALALQAQERAYRAQDAGREERQRFEPAVEQLQQDLQLAGAGLPQGTLPAISPGPREGNPIITIRYLTEEPFVTTLTMDATDTSRLFRVPPDAIERFRPGDQVLIHHRDVWLAFRVEGVETRRQAGLIPAPEIQHSSVGPWDRLAFPSGSEVIRLRDAEVAYVLAKNDVEGYSLLRRKGSEERVVAVGLQEFRLDYLVAETEDAKLARLEWIATPPGDTPIRGARVRLATGKTSLSFTVTPRNLALQSPS